MNELKCKATVEINGGTITFEGPQNFVERQVELWMPSPPSKQTDSVAADVRGIGATSPGATERTLITDKQPSGHLETVAVMAFALTQAGMQEFSEEDVRRAYLRAGVRPPKVVAQALRDAKNRADYIEAGSRRGLYRLSHYGDTFVRFDLPHT
jgi:hypothetical protein